MKARKTQRILFLALVCLLFSFFAGSGSAQNADAPVPTSAPDVRVEFFGPERGYAIGAQGVTLLCVARNVGTAPLPENTLRLRCFAMVGLEYTTGDTRPILPALGQNQAVAFRWKLAPSGSQGPMIAAVLLENITGGSSGPAADGGQNPIIVSLPTAARATLAVIPRLSNTPRASSAAAAPGAAPRASRGAEDATLINDRVQVRVIAGEKRSPLLVLAARDGKDWRAVATGTPLMEVLAGEDGQLPWWETFRWTDTRVSNEKTRATLTLLGNIGKRWRAELTLESNSGTSAIEGRLRVTALRSLRLYGARLPRLLPTGAEAGAAKSDGSALSVFQNDPILPTDIPLRAARSGSVSFGITWPSAPPLAGWKWLPPATYDTNLLSVLGPEWSGPNAGGIMQQGTSLSFTFRLFALAPSDTLKDALRFMPP